MFEKVIKDVCENSQVDFEESGVDQKTLHDLREVSSYKMSFIWLISMALGVVTLGRVNRKRGNPKWCGRQCLWGNTGL